MRLSIVLPVFNVEKYLAKCLDSLLNQDIPKDDYEIVVINDGSMDNSLTIALEYSNRFSNISIVNQENQGLSGARNSGIMAAKGKYIQFVDSDDYLEPNVLGALIRKMEEEDLDILRFNYQNVNENYQVVAPNKNPKQYVDYRDEITDGQSFLSEKLGTACYACQFILRTELVRNQPLFKEGIYFEDTEWTPRVLANAKRVTSVDTIVYNYLIREGSITKGNSIEKKRKIVEDKLSLIESLKNQLESVSDKRWYYGMISSTVISLLGCVVEDFFSERNRYIKKLKQMNVFPISEYHLNKGALRKQKLINISPLLFCWFYKLKNL